MKRYEQATQQQRSQPIMSKEEKAVAILKVNGISALDAADRQRIAAWLRGYATTIQSPEANQWDDKFTARCMARSKK